MMKEDRYSAICFFVGVWALVIACGMMFAAPPWSETMRKRAALGFHHNLDNVVLAWQLASTPEQFHTLLPAAPAPAKTNVPAAESGPSVASISLQQDVEKLRYMTRWDFVFILGYFMAFVTVIVRLRRLKVLPSVAWQNALLICVFFLSLLDVAENILSLYILQATHPKFHPLLPILCWLKWLLGFCLVSVLGWMIIRTTRHGRGRSLTGPWCLTGLLFLTGGITGLIGVLDRDHMILIRPGYYFIYASLFSLWFVWRRRNFGDFQDSEPGERTRKRLGGKRTRQRLRLPSVTPAISLKPKPKDGGGEAGKA